MKNMFVGLLLVGLGWIASEMSHPEISVAAQPAGFRCYGRINADRAAGVTAPITAKQIMTWGNHHFCENRSGGANVVGFGTMFAQNLGSTVVVRLPILEDFILGRVVVFTTRTGVSGFGATINAEVTTSPRQVEFRLSQASAFYYSIAWVANAEDQQ
jgi:hypothetical protein